MNDTTIGNTSSGATTQGGYTFQLFKTLWDGVSNTWAHIQDSAGTPTTRGATAVADFLANKRLPLPFSLGRAMANLGGGAVLGQNAGASTVPITGANLPPGTPFNTSAASGSIAVTGGSGHNVPANDFFAYSQGSGTQLSIVPPTTYFNVFIKL
jgi:hypothetical protein